MLSLVEAKLRKLFFEPVRLRFPSIRQMILGHDLFSGGDKQHIQKVYFTRRIY